MGDSTIIVGFLALFAGVGVVFLFVNLALGWLVRPANPHVEKLEIYECGEPTIGSSFVQFDLRFYVVALLFIIFDVEVAFFFPWATVFGKSVELMDKDVVVVQATDELSPAGKGLLLELGIANPQAPTVNGEGQPIEGRAMQEAALHRTGRTMVKLAIVDISVFFAVLMVGFAYVWKRGDLDWVRAVARQRVGQVERLTHADVAADEPILTA
jgi:NADH-quinone oxidoreductase subunit A